MTSGSHSAPQWNSEATRRRWCGLRRDRHWDATCQRPASPGTAGLCTACSGQCTECALCARRSFWRNGNWGRTFSARREAGGWMRMKELYVEGVAARNGPEFMRRRSQGRRRSVDRGNGGLGIEPRNVECPGRRRYREKRKATRRAPSWRGARRPRAVRDPVHAGTPSTRKPGGPWIAWRGCARPQRQGYGRNPLMHGPGKSDPPIVPGKRPNRPGRPGAEAVEGRGGAKGTAGRQARAGLRAGKPCHRRWPAYEKQQSGTGMNDSPR